MKKSLVLLLIVALTLSGCSLFKKKKKEAEITKKPAINEPVNVIDLSERPYITIMPKNDGRHLDLAINSLNKSATEAEYELEYQAGTLLQGAFGSIELDKIPVTKDILLGTCSAGGACSYHENVQGGTLVLKFRGEPNYVLKDEWRFQPVKDADGAFSSKDAKLQIEVGTQLKTSNYVVLMQTSGLPEKIEGDVIAGPYGVFPSNGIPEGTEADITIRTDEQSETATIYGWDGSSWNKYDTKVDGKSVTTTGALASVYVVTK